LLCASDTTRYENWWQNLWIRASMCKRVSHLPQEEMMSTVMQFPAHIANCDPMFSMKCSNVHSHTSLLLATDLGNCHDNYCLLSIPTSVHSIVPSFKTNSCCCCTRVRNEGSLWPTPRTGLPNTSLPICACEIRNLSRLHKFWKRRRLLCP
jgi:hypothetical protein